MPVSPYKFGEFELDCARYQLRRNGQVLKLERIPLELLILLAEKDGNVVTRQEIIDRLWGKDVFVDTEHGINTAIRKIRAVLREDVEHPRFLETVTGKGYRFIIEKNGHPLEAHAAPPLTGEAPPQAELEDPPQPKSGEPPPTTWGQPPRLSSGADSSRRTADAAATPVPKPKPKLALALTLTLLLAAATLLFAFRHQILPTNHANQIHSIAVIPLTNVSGDPSQEYFADGLTDELITALAKNHALRIVSRTSAMQYKGARRPIADIARELGVDGILEGSVSQSANRVHMTVQLIHAPSDTHIWAESYDRDLSEMISLPEELAQTVAKEVKTAVSPPAPQRHINPEAHDAYLRGLYLWFNFDAVHSVEYFQKAIDLQPDYAAAWAGLASAHLIRAIDGQSPASEVGAKGEAAARKAVELDDSLAWAHNSLAAWYLFFARDLPHADAESKRSIELDPGDAELHHLRSFVLGAMNRMDDSLAESKRCNELDPFARSWGMGYAYLRMRQFDAAISDLKLRVQALPSDTFSHAYLGQAYWMKHMYPEWEQENEKMLQAFGRADGAAALHHAFEQGGMKAAAQWGVDDILARGRTTYVSPYDVATYYSYLGDKPQTLHYLEEAYRDRSPWLVLVQCEPVFDFLHSDPRYQALVKKVGLPPAY